jgi:Cu+-exporting ATPase
MLYDTSIMLGSFLMLGKYLEDRAKGKTSDSIKKLVQLKATDATVQKIIGGKTVQEKIPINDVLKARGQETKPWGDIWYRASSLVPVDSGTN